MRRKSFKLIFVFAAITGLLVFLYFTDIADPIKEKIYQVFNPITSRFYSLSTNIRNTYKVQTDKIDMAKEMEELKNKIDHLTVENAKMNELSEENEKLRAHLNFLEVSELKYIMAHVISRGLSVSPEEKEKDIIIDRGRTDGLYPGLAVVNSEGILIGKLDVVEEKISRINLSTNSDCRLAATIQNVDRTIGVVAGKLGLTINMDFISQDENVNEGDLVVTSGLEENVPRGLVIGEVSRIDSSNNEIWKSVVVEPLVDFDDLIIVSVIIP